MKTSILSIVTLCFFFSTHAQNACEKAFSERIQKEITTSHSSFNGFTIYIKGDKAEKLSSTLLDGNQNKKFISKVKHLRVPGVNGEIEFKIHQGMHGYNKDVLSFHFRTYKNKKNKLLLLASMDETNEVGVIIYLKKNGKELVTNKGDVQLIIAYILRLSENA